MVNFVAHACAHSTLNSIKVQQQPLRVTQSDNLLTDTANFLISCVPGMPRLVMSDKANPAFCAPAGCREQCVGHYAAMYTCHGKLPLYVRIPTASGTARNPRTLPTRPTLPASLSRLNVQTR